MRMFSITAFLPDRLFACILSVNKPVESAEMLTEGHRVNLTYSFTKETIYDLIIQQAFAGTAKQTALEQAATIIHQEASVLLNPVAHISMRRFIL